jgi:hypothetical protein
MRLVSRFRMLNNCGNSSRLVRRKIFPILVTRGSSCSLCWTARVRMHCKVTGDHRPQTTEGSMSRASFHHASRNPECCATRAVRRGHCDPHRCRGQSRVRCQKYCSRSPVVRAEQISEHRAPANLNVGRHRHFRRYMEIFGHIMKGEPIDRYPRAVVWFRNSERRWARCA